MNELQSIIEKYQLEEHACSGKIIVLDQVQTRYILTAGDLNLFVIELDTQGHFSTRHFFCSLAEQNLSVLQGVTQQSDAPLKLCAVAQLNTYCVEVPQNIYQQLTAEEKALFDQAEDDYKRTLQQVAQAQLAQEIPFDAEAPMTPIFGQFIAAQQDAFRKQYQHILSTSQQAKERSFANLFSFVHQDISFQFECSGDDLVDAIKALGTVQSLHFSIPQRDAYPNEECFIDAIAQQSQVRKRTISLELNWQDKSSVPFLATTNEGLYVAIFPNSKREEEWLCFDSQSKLVKKVDRQLIDSLNLKAIIFYTPLPDGSLGLKDLLGLIWDMSKSDIARILILFFIASLLGSSIPVINGVIFSTVIPMADRDLLMQIFVLALAFALTKSIIEYLNSIMLLRIRGRVEWAIQSGIWDRLLNLPIRFFKDFSIGDMADRSLGIMQLVDIFNTAFIKNVLTWVFSFPALLLMFYYSPTLAVAMLFFMLLMVLYFIICGVLSYKLQNKITSLSGEIHGDLIQYFAGINKMRATRTENQTLEHWSKKFAEKKELYFKFSSYQKITSTLSSALPIASIAIMIGMVLLTFSEKPEENITAADFIAFSSALAIVSGALGTMISSVMGAINAIPIYKRVQPLLEAESEVDSKQTTLTNLSGNIAIRHVNFRYNDSQSMVLNDLSFNVQEGEFIAVVGESGSGKSTLLRLLLGFDKPISGSISYDGIDLNQADLKQLRSQLGVVLQNGKLLLDSIYKNISSGSALMTHNDAWEAAEMAGCAEDIKAMPMQMHTMLSGESGGISGGQKQRILIARALAKKPKILFFDEATSALDNNAQHIVNTTLTQLPMTKIIIAHRLSTVINADRILVMSRGQLIEEGNYEQLMALDGYFAKLAQRQLLNKQSS